MSLKLIDHFVYLITLAADYMSPIAYFKKAIGHSLFESIAPESTISILAELTVSLLWVGVLIVFFF